MIIGPSGKNTPVFDANKSSLFRGEDVAKIGKKGGRKDSFSFSEVAQKTAILKRYIDYAHSAPDIREDKVLQAKENLKKYMREDNSIDPAVLDNIVSQLSKTLL